MDQPVYSAGGRWHGRGAIRAFHEAGLWNLFEDTAFDLSNVLSTHTLFGTLLEGSSVIRRRRASAKWLSICFI